MSQKIKAPEGYCPNCWGYYEYDKKALQAAYDEQIDVNNHQKLYTFIKDWVVKNLDGIKLKRDEEGGVYCEHCHSEIKA